MAKRHHLLGEVSLLGLDEFGQNPGMSPLWGAAIGGGVASVTSIAIGHTQPTMVADRSFWGFMAGLGASGILYAMKSTRHAAFGSALGAFFAAGVPWLEQKLLGTVQLPAPAATVVQAVAQQAQATGQPMPGGTPGGVAPGGVAGLGIPKVKYLNGLGIPKVKYLNGLGLPTIAPQPKSVGTIPGVAGPAFAGAQIGAARPPVNLLGSPTAASRQVALMGGPAVHGLSAAYGATLLGGGRG